MADPEHQLDHELCSLHSYWCQAPKSDRTADIIQTIEQAFLERMMRLLVNPKETPPRNLNYPDDLPF